MNTVLDPPITSSCSKSLLFFPSFLPALNITRPIPLSSLTSQFEPRSPIQTLLLCSRRHHQVERETLYFVEKGDNESDQSILHVCILLTPRTIFIANMSNFLITKYSFICTKATTFGCVDQLCDL